MFFKRHQNIEIDDCELYTCLLTHRGRYLWEVSPSHHEAVGGPLQDLPHAIVKAQRGPVQRAVYLTLVQPRPAIKAGGGC